MYTQTHFGLFESHYIDIFERKQENVLDLPYRSHEVTGATEMPHANTGSGAVSCAKIIAVA